MHVSKDQADIYILVLSALGISHEVEKTEDGFHILIDEKDMENARYHLTKYFEENPGERERTPVAPLNFRKNHTGLLIAILLLWAYGIVEWMGVDRRMVINIYAASSRHILNGEVYRALTALFFHDGPVHLMANMAGMTIFGSIACAMTGSGLGVFMILLSGVVGNLLTAVCYSDMWHRSIGGSTAVFGAIGMITGREFFIRIRISMKQFRAFLPLGSAAALLAFLSSGTNTDIMAHLFGLGAGIMVGIIHVRFEPGPERLLLQKAALVASILFTVAAFLSPIVFI